MTHPAARADAVRTTTAPVGRRLQLHAERPVVAAAPFAVVALLGILTLLLPPYADGPLHVAFALGCAAATVALALAVGLLPRTSRAVAVPPILFFVVVAVLRDATGGASSPFTSFVLLPILWVVLYGTRAQLWTSAAVSALVLLTPGVLLDRPGYDVADWRRAAIWVLVVLLVCPPLQHRVEALRRSTETQSRLSGQLSSVLHAATEHAIIAADLEGRVTLFSEGAERMLGYTAAEVLGQGPQLLHEEAEVRARADELGIAPGFDVFVHGIGADGSTTGVWTYRRRDRTTLRVRLTVTRLVDAAGTHTGWMGVATDITAEERAQLELAAAERRWRTLLDHLPDTSVLVVGPDLRYRVAVGAGLARQGMAHLAGRTLAETSNATNTATLGALYGQALAGRIATGEVRSTHTGAVNEIVVVPLPDNGGEREALVLSRDVSEARAREEALRVTRDRFERLFDETTHGKVLVDRTGVVTEVNPAFCTMLDLAAEQVVGSSVTALPDLGDDPTWLTPLLRGEHAHLTVERTLRPGSGDPLHAAVTVVALTRDGVLDGLLVTVVDVSERVRYQAQLAHLADHDPLTGLANRRKFDSELTAHLERCRRYGARGAVVMLDLDNFKQVNDTLGHSAGDQLIVSVAQLLSERLRVSDVVARLGGDEFAILLPEATRTEAEKVAQDVVDLVRERAAVLDGTRAWSVTASLGVVLVQDPTTLSPGELMATADMTMYDAKDAGRDTFVLHDTEDYAVPRTGARIAWANRIAAALQDEAFVVHAQPVLDLRAGRVTGAELLVRMVGTDGELVVPGRFLYIAERVGLVTEIDLFMISRAVEVLAAAQAVDPGFVVEVNLSGRSVGSARVSEHVVRCLAESGVDPHGLVFEITETAAVADIESARAFAERIRALGCRFALDDFGAGFGSFYYLKHLVFDFIKIDGEFVARCPANATDRLIISSIVDLAHGLGCETIAEFVADEEILEVVRNLGVDHAQGYQLGRPEPVEHLLAALRARAAEDAVVVGAAVVGAAVGAELGATLIPAPRPTADPPRAGTR